MHEENVLSSWLREDGKDKKEGHVEADRETEEEMSKQRTREEEKEENKTVIAKRRRVNPVSTEVFDIIGHEEDSETCDSWCDLWDDSCGLSDCDSVTWTSLLVVNDVLVCPSSAVAETCEGVSSGSDWEFVEPQFFFVLPKAFVCLCGESRRAELRRDASKSASEYQKKDDAAHATAKFTFIDG